MHELAIFPLGTVLFPGGLLPLRIFEPRYVDMVGRCMRQSEVFGVVLALGGRDTDRQVGTAEVGCTARIIDFHTLEDGLLGILCRGERRFRILTRSRQDDGLNRAGVEWVPEPARSGVPAQFQPLLPVLRKALSQLRTMGHLVESDYDNAAWVGYRLAELLPLDASLQQQMLESQDPIDRLRRLAPLIDPSG